LLKGEAQTKSELQPWEDNPQLMRIMKLVKYRLKAQVEKDEGPEAETLSRLLIVVEGPS